MHCYESNDEKLHSLLFIIIISLLLLFNLKILITRQIKHDRIKKLTNLHR